MKMFGFLVAAVLLAFATAASAVDVVAKVTIEKGGKAVYRATNEFLGMSAGEAADLNKRGMKTLDHAAKLQDKKGDYKIVWEWSEDGKAQPVIETAGMTFGGVNSTMRLGAKWLDGVVSQSEKQQASKKGRPWGN